MTVDRDKFPNLCSPQCGSRSKCPESYVEPDLFDGYDTRERFAFRYFKIMGKLDERFRQITTNIGLLQTYGLEARSDMWAQRRT